MKVVTCNSASRCPAAREPPGPRRGRPAVRAANVCTFFRCGNLLTLMPAAGQPTAEGELGQTPFAHLVVYAMERKLTGTLQLEENSTSPEPRIHRLTFVRGAPAKIKPADDFARLGRLLTDEGLIDDDTL